MYLCKHVAAPTLSTVGIDPHGITVGECDSSLVRDRSDASSELEADRETELGLLDCRKLNGAGSWHLLVIPKSPFSVQCPSIIT